MGGLPPTLPSAFPPVDPAQTVKMDPPGAGSLDPGGEAKRKTGNGKVMERVRKHRRR